MATKLEMGKAYDRMEWNFIKTCFQDLEFFDRWIE